MRLLRLSQGGATPRFSRTFCLSLLWGGAGAEMKLANDAPIVAVPMCVKQIDG